MAEEEGPTRLKRSFSERLRRKSQVARGEAVPDMPESSLPPDAVAPTDETDEEAALSDEELLAKYGVDDPEAIEDEDKLDALLKDQFPDRIRQMALRRMWRLNPLFRFADEMVEYGENYTDAATVIDGMQTAYQVGKGYLQRAFDAVDDDAADAAVAGTEANPLADGTQQSQLAGEASPRDQDDPAGKAEEAGKPAPSGPASDATSDATSDTSSGETLQEPAGAATIEPVVVPGATEEMAGLDTTAALPGDGDDVPPPRPRRMSFRRPPDNSAA